MGARRHADRRPGAGGAQRRIPSSDDHQETSLPVMTLAAPPPSASLVVDPPTLQRRALELLAVVDADPRRGVERIAAAEAHLRLVVTGAAKDKATKLLERAIELDPYRAGTYLVAALIAHREGRLTAAL